MRITIIFFFFILLIAGCSYRNQQINSSLADPVKVISSLNQQFSQWQGTPYQYGGTSRKGIDCSGFVWLTFNRYFNISLPRTTLAQSKTGHVVKRKNLQPGDLLFFKTGRGKSGLHVGIYNANNKFIHASTKRGVTRSSLNNRYWRSVFWQARRL